MHLLKTSLRPYAHRISIHMHSHNTCMHTHSHNTCVNTKYMYMHSHCTHACTRMYTWTLTLYSTHALTNISSCPRCDILHLQGVISSVFEVGAMSCMVFYVLPRLPSIVAILVLSGVFPAQALVDICYLPCILNCFKDDANHGLLQQQSRFSTWMKKANKVLENKCSRIIALILQAASILVMAVFAFLYDHDNIGLAIAIGLSLFVLSIVWSSKVQQEWKFWTCCKCCKKYVECVERGTDRNQAEITRSEASK